MTIHYYIISVDTETNEWELDADKESELFPNGTVYDVTTNEWSSDYTGDGEFNETAEQLTITLTQAIETLNKGK